MRTVLALTALLVAVFSGPALAAPPLMPGDVNGDGLVDAGDVALLHRHVTEGASLTPEGADAADVAPLVTGVPVPDGTLDVADVLVVARAARGDVELALSGTIDTAVTWPAGARVGLDDDVTVTQAGSLTIGAGATIVVAPGVRVNIDGALDAQGTSTEKILWKPTTETRGSWDGIYLDGAGTLSDLEIAYARFGVRVQNPFGTSTPVTIVNSMITEFTDAGIAALGSSNVIIDNVQISNDPSNDPQTGRQGNAVTIQSSGSVTVQGSPLSGASRGIQISGLTTPLIQGNTISSNSRGIEVLARSVPTIVANLITDNGRGIQVQNGGGPAFDPDPDIDGNQIYANTDWNLRVEEFGHTDFNVRATNNYWGSDDPIAIKEGIFDASNATTAQSAPWAEFIPFQFPFGMNATQTGTYLWKEVVTPNPAGPVVVNGPGPHAVVGKVTVQPGVELRIEHTAPMMVRTGSTSDLLVLGTLNVLGSDPDGVTFVSGNRPDDPPGPLPGDWEGIHYQPGSSGTIDHAVILDAKLPIDIETATVTVSDSIIRDFDQGNASNDPAAIRVRDSASAALTDNTIDGTLALAPHPRSNGISVVESFITDLTGNDITGARIGVLLKGAGTLPLLGPFTGNAIYDNFTGVEETNLKLVDIPNPAGPTWLTLNAQRNFWGDADPAVAAGTISQDPPAFSAKVSIDFSNLLDDIDGSEVTGDFYKFVLYDVTRDRDAFNPQLNEDVTISFRLGTPASVALRVCLETSGACVGDAVYEATQSYPAGPNSVAWAGQDMMGNPVAPAAYQYRLIAADTGPADGVNEGTYNPAYTGATLAQPTVTLRDLDPVSGLATVDPETNLAAVWDVNLDHPARLSLWLQATKIIPTAPFAAGASTIRWTGRDETDTPLSGSFQVHVVDDYRLRTNSVIARGIPSITGSPPAVEVRATPYWVFKSYGHFESDFVYRVDQDATVEVKLLPPGVLDPDHMDVTTLFSGMDLAGVDRPVSIDLSVIDTQGEGTYNIRIQATNSAGTDTHWSAVKLWR